jgi:Rrf2 family protein
MGNIGSVGFGAGWHTRSVRITAKVDYAVRAACELASQGGQRPVKGDAVATAQGIPVKFLENILAEMRRAGIVSSQRGADGGYWLARPAEHISVADIIRAVEGPLADVHGEPPEEATYEGPAQHLREVWVATRASLRSVLERVSVADIVAGSLPDDLEQLIDDPDSWARRGTRAGPVRR